MFLSRKFALCAVFAAALACAPAFANTTAVLEFDENGNGTLSFDGAPATPLYWNVIPDPANGNRPTLWYFMAGPPTLTLGDLVIFEPNTTVVSDLLRFSNEGGFGIFVYSDNSDGVDELADVSGIPFPPFMQPTAFTEEIGPEGNNYVSYIPVVGQPGSVYGYDVTYVFHSDVGGIPEPGSVLLMMSGAAALLLLRRRR